MHALPPARVGASVLRAWDVPAGEYMLRLSYAAPGADAARWANRVGLLLLAAAAAATFARRRPPDRQRSSRAKRDAAPAEGHLT